MALWSAALFGHYKPRYYLRDKLTGLIRSAHVELPPIFDASKQFLHLCDGWKRRAEPGDIIAVRPYAEHDRWTDTERKQFLIVTLDDFDLTQLAGIVEPNWDTESYPVVPQDEINRLMQRGERVELMPQRHIKKRRFHITLDDLRDRGVDIDRMLNKELRYDPDLEPIKKIKCYDKLNDRYARKDDGFNLLPPVKVGRIV